MSAGPEIDNGTIAELLAREADEAKETLRRAFKRAARAAFLWPVEASQMVQRNQSLTEFPAVGPYMERRIRCWIEQPPKDVQPNPVPLDWSGQAWFQKARSK